MSRVLISITVSCLAWLTSLGAESKEASAFLHESKVSWEMNEFPIHRWKTLVGGEAGPEDILFGTWELAPHASYHGHKHDAPEIYYVISGKALWTVGDETQEVTKGMAIYTKPGAVHKMVNLTDKPVQAIWIWWAPNGDREVFNGKYVFTEEPHTQPENAEFKE